MITTVCDVRTVNVTAVVLSLASMAWCDWVSLVACWLKFILDTAPLIVIEHWSVLYYLLHNPAHALFTL
jgi:hypothetical protein